MAKAVVGISGPETSWKFRFFTSLCKLRSRAVIVTRLSNHSIQRFWNHNPLPLNSNLLANHSCKAFHFRSISGSLTPPCLYPLPSFTTSDPVKLLFTTSQALISKHNIQDKHHEPPKKLHELPSLPVLRSPPGRQSSPRRDIRNPAIPPQRNHDSCSA